jgi:hypothetical protein
MSGRTPVCAIVLAQGDAARLARVLASLEWAAERIVLDPAEHVADDALPAGVRRVTDPAALPALTRSEWLLLLCENETPSAAFATAVAEAVGGAPTAWAVRRELHALDVRLALLGAPVRLAPRRGAQVTVRIGLDLVLEPAVAMLVQHLRPPLVIEWVPTLDEAVRSLDAESTTFAALLERLGRRPRVRGLLVNPWVAAVRVLAARGRGGVGFGRWILAVLLGYRVVTAHAKLWERGRDRLLPEAA